MEFTTQEQWKVETGSSGEKQSLPLGNGQARASGVWGGWMVGRENKLDDDKLFLRCTSPIGLILRQLGDIPRVCLPLYGGCQSG